MAMYNINQDNGKFSHEVRDYVKRLEDSFIHDREHKVYDIIIEHVERTVLETVLERTFGNQVKASKILGINRNTLRTKIKKLGINIERWKL